MQLNCVNFIHFKMSVSAAHLKINKLRFKYLEPCLYLSVFMLLGKHILKFLK